MKLLWLVPAFPLLGYLLLAAAGKPLGERITAWIGAGSVGFSALTAWIVAFRYLSTPLPDAAYAEKLWTWMEIGVFAPPVTLRLDPLSLIMMLVVASVGFLIHLYSTEFMAGDEGYA